jgi:hypothetical protein
VLFDGAPDPFFCFTGELIKLIFGDIMRIVLPPRSESIVQKPETETIFVRYLREKIVLSIDFKSLRTVLLAAPTSLAISDNLGVSLSRINPIMETSVLLDLIPDYDFYHSLMYVVPDYNSLFGVTELNVRITRTRTAEPLSRIGMLRLVGEAGFGVSGCRLLSSQFASFSTLSASANRQLEQPLLVISSSIFISSGWLKSLPLIHSPK